MSTIRPLVTVLVPARDEAPYVLDCLESIAAQDYPRAALEVLVVLDGASRDATQELVEEWFEARGFAQSRVFRNPEAGTPSNLNLGLTNALGEYLCRVDARSRIPTDYVSRCVGVLESRRDVAVVGGAQVAISPRHGAVGTGIARALNNRWGMGWSRYRRDAASGACDTVYLGAFRTADLRCAGGWDTALGTNQDFDLNRRMSRLGLVWYESALPVGYVPRATIGELYRQYLRFGRWKVRYWRHTGDRPRPRQIALLVAPPAAAAVLAAAAVMAPIARLVLLGAVLALAVAFETIGSRRPRGGVAAHFWAVLAGAVVAGAWLGGALRELAGRGSARAALPVPIDDHR